MYDDALAVAESGRPEEVGVLTIVVGAGGIGYHGRGLLCARVRRQDNPYVMVMDPDRIEKKNLVRQWLGAHVGDWKAQALSGYLAGCDVEGDFACLRVEDCNTLVLPVARLVEVYAWPDNDEARFATQMKVREYVERVKPEWCGLVAAGNDAEGANVYGSVYRDGNWYYDWVPHLKQMRKDGMIEERTTECGDQTAQCNAMAANMSMIMMDTLWGWQPGDTEPGRYIFDVTLPRMWKEASRI